MFRFQPGYLIASLICVNIVIIHVDVFTSVAIFLVESVNLTSHRDILVVHIACGLCDNIKYNSDNLCDNIK